MKNIIVAEDDNQIIDAIINYDKKIKKLNNKNSSNNKRFCDLLKEEIEKII